MKIPAQYAKFITALITQALAFAQYKYGSGNEWVSIATALAGALAVLAVPNAPKTVPAPPPAPPSVTTTPPAV